MAENYFELLDERNSSKTPQGKIEKRLISALRSKGFTHEDMETLCLILNRCPGRGDDFPWEALDCLFTDSVFQERAMELWQELGRQ
jgi:hypothetical protein